MSNPFPNTEQQPIDRDTALEMLVSVFPDLKRQWDAYLASEYKEPSEERLSYIDISEIIRYIIEKRKHIETSGFDEFFARVETILIHGDRYTSELIVIGLLEGLQDGSEIDYHSAFNDWLRPDTKKAWDKLIQFWEGNGSAK